MKIAFLASPRPAAQRVLKLLIKRYGQSAMANADYVVTVGGDGTALKALHGMLPGSPVPVFAMRSKGSLGYLCNPLQVDGLAERLQKAVQLDLPVLQAETLLLEGQRQRHFGVSEIVLFRQRLQQARFTVIADGRELAEIKGDGLILATPVGSTGYNRSVLGPCLPIASSLLALTGIATRQPAGWCNIVLNDRVVLDIEIVEADHHPVRLETVTDISPGVRRARLFRSGDHKAMLLLEKNVLDERLSWPNRDIAEIVR